MVAIPLRSREIVISFFSLFLSHPLSFVLDLDNGQLHLTFSETINSTSFRIEELAIQSTFTALGTAGVVLSQKSATSIPSHVITVNLSENALNALKADTQVSDIYNNEISS